MEEWRGFGPCPWGIPSSPISGTWGHDVAIVNDSAASTCLKVWLSIKFSFSSSRSTSLNSPSPRHKWGWLHPPAPYKQNWLKSSPMSWWSSVGIATGVLKDIRINDWAKPIRGHLPGLAIGPTEFSSLATDDDPQSDAPSPPFHLPQLPTTAKEKNQLRNHQKVFKNLRNRLPPMLTSPNPTPMRWKPMPTKLRTTSKHPSVPPLKKWFWQLIFLPINFTFIPLSIPLPLLFFIHFSFYSDRPDITYCSSDLEGACNSSLSGSSFSFVTLTHHICSFLCHPLSSLYHHGDHILFFMWIRRLSNISRLLLL